MPSIKSKSTEDDLSPRAGADVLNIMFWDGGVPSMKTKICILHKETSSFSQLKKKKNKTKQNKQTNTTY